MGAGLGVGSRVWASRAATSLRDAPFQAPTFHPLALPSLSRTVQRIVAAERTARASAEGAANRLRAKLEAVGGPAAVAEALAAGEE